MRPEDLSQSIAFVCNICGAGNCVTPDQLGRETPSCASCGSTVRMRTIAHIVTKELLGSPVDLPDLPVRKDLKGIGMSCWTGYAGPLAERFDYTNTFYHQAPRLDITNIDESQVGQFDFITSTDVFEHVAPPVSRAFVNARRLLKPDGVLVFSVPYRRPTRWWQRTTEHYPDLHDYSIVRGEEGVCLRNVTRAGKVQIFPDPVFHGGEGATLEMRVFSQRSLIRQLLRAGFNDISIYRSSYLSSGILWLKPWSLALAARVRRKRARRSWPGRPCGSSRRARSATTRFPHAGACSRSRSPGRCTAAGRIRNRPTGGALRESSAHPAR